MSQWFREELHPGFAQVHEIQWQLASIRSAFQHIQVLDTRRFGKLLVLDNVVQCSVADEFIYHEMLVHVPLFSVADPKRVLIVGGGDGGALKQALKHPTVEQVTLVEIDRQVVDVARQHLSEICADAFDDSRTQIVYSDAVEFVDQDSSGQYDVVILDRPDCVGCAQPLFTSDFYAACKRLMSSRGVLVAQNGVLLSAEYLWGTVRMLTDMWSASGIYLCTVPTYVGGLTALAWAGGTDIRSIPSDILDSRYRAAALNDLRCYTPAIHRAAFAVPPYFEGDGRPQV